MSLETLHDRCRVALALGEPIYITQGEYQRLVTEVLETAHSLSGLPTGAARYMGCDIVIDFDRALLQGNRYGMTIDQLVTAKAQHDAAIEAGMRLLHRLWPDP